MLVLVLVLVLVPVLSEKVPLLVLEKTPPKAQRNPSRLETARTLGDPSSQISTSQWLS